jgi:diadenylate cyclase
MLVPVTIFDIIDILLVAFIMFQLYRIMRGTAAVGIFIAVAFLYFFWLLVKALTMQLVSSLLGQVIGVGVIALIIVFQQEVRRFLLVIGNRYIKNNKFSISKFLKSSDDEPHAAVIAGEIVDAVTALSDHKTGALIVIGRQSRLDVFTEGGEILRAKVTAGLLETIFFKNTPLHDGAVLIEDNLVMAARCPLPVTSQADLPAHFGMRHRAALGMSEQTDALVIVVSEETGSITIADSGEVRSSLTPNELRDILLMEKIW